MGARGVPQEVACFDDELRIIFLHRFREPNPRCFPHDHADLMASPLYNSYNLWFSLSMVCVGLIIHKNSYQPAMHTSLIDMDRKAAPKCEQIRNKTKRLCTSTLLLLSWRHFWWIHCQCCCFWSQVMASSHQVSSHKAVAWYSSTYEHSTMVYYSTGDWGAGEVRGNSSPWLQ